MKIAVTGSSGFIGSRILFDLESRGHEVIGLVRPSLDDVQILANKLKGVETVCHCAWTGHPRNETEGQRNVFTSMIVGKAADLAGVEHMVFMSSGGGLNGNTSYSVSKREVEILFSTAFGLFDYEKTILRPTAVYGPGQDPSKGLGAVITFLNAVLTEEPIHILGSPYSGRDFLHVDDLAECTSLIIEKKIFGTFEVGGPKVVQLNELIEMIERKAGKTARVQIENPTGVDPQTIQLDNSEITAATGWYPKRSVEDSLIELIRKVTNS